jgi:hypothetical protein
MVCVIALLFTGFGGVMRDSTALTVGASLGAVCSLAALPIGFAPIEISFAAAVVLFVFTFSCVIVFTLFGWPNRSIGFDFYDLNRSIVGLCLAALVVSFTAAMTEKVADTFSLNLLVAGTVSLLAIALYIAAGASLFSLFRRQMS